MFSLYSYIRTGIHTTPSLPIDYWGVPMKCPPSIKRRGVSRCAASYPPLFFCLFYVYTVARCTQLLPTPQGMPLTASHAPLLTLHMLWIDLSKSFMTFSRAVGQLLQAKRGVPALFLLGHPLLRRSAHVLYLTPKGTQFHLSPWYSHGWLPTSHDCPHRSRISAL